MSPSPLSIAFSLLLLILSIWLFNFLLRKPGRKLPPGPWGLPVIGHLHMLGLLPHRTLHKMSQKHGPIMSIRLGLVPTIVVSSPRAAELFLKTHDANFASRPQIKAWEQLYDGSKGMAFAEYGQHWRSMRKLCASELLSVPKVEGFQGMRREEVALLLRRLKEAARGVVDLSEEVAHVVEDMTCRMVFGRISDERFDLKGVVKEVLELVGTFNPGDFLPFLAPFDIQVIP